MRVKLTLLQKFLSEFSVEFLSWSDHIL